MKAFDDIQKALKTPQRVIITTHHKPDGDAMGSSLAWGHYLKKKGHQVHVITPSDYPEFLNWLPGNEEVIVFSQQTKETIQKHINESTLICCLDFSSLARIETIREMVEKSTARKLVIDHHLDPEPFADITYWDVKAAATCELIYELIEQLGDLHSIDSTIGTCIYTGIMTDTSSFRHPSTTKKVHEIAGVLIEKGINTSAIHRLIYDNNSENRLRLLGYVLLEKIIILPEYKTAYVALTAAELKRFDSKTGDTEGLVNFLLSIKNIVLAVILIDRTEAVKLSFRSIGDFSVNSLSKNHFSGGGHKNAAGGISHESLEKTVEKFLSVLPLYKEQLDQLNKDQLC